MAAKADFMRPNFWPNTPDILAPSAQRPARPRSSSAWCWPPPWSRPTASTAATSWARTPPPRSANEEYLYSEKYRDGSTGPGRPPPRWPRSSPTSTTSAAATRRSPQLGNIRFHGTFNEAIMLALLEAAQRRRLRHRPRGRSTSTPIVAHDDTVVLDLEALGMPSNGPSPPTTSSRARRTRGRARAPTCGSTGGWRPTCSTSAGGRDPRSHGRWS